MEKNRGRREVRITRVYERPDNLAKGWETVQSVTKIYRKIYRHAKPPMVETAYFISSLASAKATAKLLHEGVRGHWSIENSLHYVKDVTFQEDNCKIRTGNAPQNISLIRNFVINILRNNGYDNLKQAIRMIANDINAIINVIS